MNKKIIPVIYFLTLLSMPAIAQFLVQGTVLDAQTGEPVPFVSIGIPELHKGTSTNTTGEFILRVDSLPVVIVFAHLSYEQQEIILDNEIPVRVRLMPSEIVMEEIVISGRPQSDHAYDLLEKAFDKAAANAGKFNYGKAFYRQISQNANDYSELYEIFYDTRFSSEGITGWAVQEGRYAMNTGPGSSDFVYNKNFTQVVRVLTVIQPATDKFIMPVSHDAKINYDVTIKGSRNIGGRKAMIIQFTPKKEISIPALEGEILIDNQSYDIYLLTGKIRHDNFDIIGLSNPVGSWKNYEIKVTVSFRNEDGTMLLDYINLDQQFDYYVSGSYKHPVATHAFLTYYEYYTPDRYKNLGGRIVRFTRSDRNILDKVGYNREFWDENPFVKRTPIEENVIASFEAKNAFGTIYLNDREQVQLENNDIDNDPFMQQALVLLKSTRIASRGEKAYLHIDKPYYAAGETIWFSAYLVNAATHLPLGVLTTLYVDLLNPDGTVRDSKIIKVDGFLHEGSIDIPPDCSTGVYRLRAYTNWMKNEGGEFFFDKPVSIYNAGEVLSGDYITADRYTDIDVHFFPEGGHSIYGIPGLVAFQATDPRGIGIEVNGKIIDDLGKQLASVSTKQNGLGNFFMMPESGRKYAAVIEYLGEEKRYDLPEALQEGISATVNSLKNNVVQVIIRTTSAYNDRDVHVIGQTRGIIYHKEKVKIVKGGAILTIPKGKLPPGIFHLTIFDDRNLPVYERLIFIPPINKMLVGIEASNENPGYREKENITVKVIDQFGKPAAGSRVSVSVLDATKITTPPHAVNIETWLLMQSDLAGNIHNPGYYFKDDERETLVALDLLMLTKGWRRFRWEKLLDSMDVDIQYSRESGINISGIVVRSGSRDPVPNAFINFISLDTDYPGYMLAASDQTGKFTLYGIDIPDSLRVIVQVLDANGKTVNAEVRIDKIDPFNSGDIPIQKFPAVVTDEISKYLNNEKQFALLNSGTGSGEKFMMKEIVVKSKRFNQEFYGRPDDVYVPGDEAMAYTDILQMIQGRFAGVQVTGSGMNAQVRIRGISSIVAGTSPLFLIDGVPISSSYIPSAPADASSSAVATGQSGGSIQPGNTGQAAQQMGNPQNLSSVEPLNSILASISPNEVERIEVLKNAGTTAIFGMRGANGVIAIYTKKGNSPQLNTLSKGFSTVRLQGYSLIREFDTTSGLSLNSTSDLPDIRSLLYWNPSMVTDRKGEIKFTYTNSDSAKKHQVVIEGITELGDIIHIIHEIGKASR
jgi:TonB-dependent SusC/RagA subfamily outer membrane receptor